MPAASSNYVAASLTEAIRKGYFQQVRFLLELGHHVDERDDVQRTALMLCSLVADSSWAMGMAQTLLEKGGRIGLRDRGGRNALHYAAIYQKLKLVELFLKAVDYDLNRGDRNGNCALFYAASSGNVEVVKSLVEGLQKYKMSLDCGNKDGVTPLMQAWRRDNFKIAEYLLEKGADTNLTDKFGKHCQRYKTEAEQRRRYRNQIETDRKLRSRIRYDDVSAWQQHQERVRSAPLVQFKGWKEVDNERLREKASEIETESLIPTAHPCDLRNNPQHVFHATPAQFFENLVSMKHENGGDNQIKSLSTLNSTSFFTNSTYSTSATASARPPASHSRPQSAMPAAKRPTSAAVVSIKAGATVSSSENEPPVYKRSARPSSASSAQGVRQGWRKEVPKFFQDLEVQGSGSYRENSKQPPPEEAATLSYYDSTGMFVRNDFSDVGSATADIGAMLMKISVKGSRRNSVLQSTKTTKENLLKKAERKSRRTSNLPSSSRSSKDGSVEDDVFSAAAGAFHSISGGGRQKKRSTLSSLGSRPVSRASHNTAVSRETPSPSVGDK